MRKRAFIETELGIELQCSKCKAFYPADTEFFYKQSRNQWGLHSWCKACYEIQPSVIARRTKHRAKSALIRKKGKQSC